MRNYNWEGKEERAAKAVAHTQQMTEYFQDLIDSAVRHTRIYGTDFVVPFEEDAKVSEPHGMLCATDSVTAAFQFVEGKTAILNFASHKNPGGMFIGGSRAQEECLCHESFLYNVLRECNDYYAWNNRNLNRGLYVNRGLYTPGVIFIHNDEIASFDVITCAAPNKTAAQKYQNVTNEENSLALRQRIRFVLDIAADNEVETLILGAYGCGVFGQDATEVAQIFKTLLPFYNFKKVIFAIPQGNGNFEKFKKVWIKEETEENE